MCYLSKTMYQWKGIEDYPNYEVSNYGHIRNIKTGRIRKHVFNHDRYHRIELCKNGKRKMKQVARVVLEAFLGIDPERPEGDHINRNRDDNRLCNLRWATRAENSQNTGEFKNNTSGEKNLSFRKERNAWEYVKRVNNKRIRKNFRTFEEAVAFKYNQISLLT